MNRFLKIIIAVASIAATGSFAPNSLGAIETVVVTGKKCSDGWTCYSGGNVRDQNEFDPYGPPETVGGSNEKPKNPNPLDDPEWGVCVKKGQDCGSYGQAALARCFATFGPMSSQCTTVGAEAMLACQGGTAPKCP